MDRRDYHDSALIVSSGPFGGDLRKAEGALCPDGIRRNAYPSHDGVADTYFSIPAYVNAQRGSRRRRVYGYVTVATVSGSSVVTDDDPATVYFHPYQYRVNHDLVEPVVEAEPEQDPAVLSAARQVGMDDDEAVLYAEVIAEREATPEVEDDLEAVCPETDYRGWGCVYGAKHSSAFPHRFERPFVPQFSYEIMSGEDWGNGPVADSGYEFDSLLAAFDAAIDRLHKLEAEGADGDKSGIYLYEESHDDAIEPKSWIWSPHLHGVLKGMDAASEDVDLGMAMPGRKVVGNPGYYLHDKVSDERLSERFDTSGEAVTEALQAGSDWERFFVIRRGDYNPELPLETVATT